MAERWLATRQGQQDAQGDRPLPALQVVFGGTQQGAHWTIGSGLRRRLTAHANIGQRSPLVTPLCFRITTVQGMAVAASTRLSDDQRSIFAQISGGDEYECDDVWTSPFMVGSLPKVPDRRDRMRVWMIPGQVVKCPCMGWVSLSCQEDILRLTFGAKGGMGEEACWNLGDSMEDRNKERLRYSFCCPFALRTQAKCKGTIIADVTRQRGVGLAHVWAKDDLRGD